MINIPSSKVFTKELTFKKHIANRIEMKAKLTLSINQEVIKKSKLLAREKRISLSQLIENFLKQSIITNSKQNLSEQIKMPGILKKMYGAVKTKDKIDYKEVYREYIIEKYS